MKEKLCPVTISQEAYVHMVVTLKEAQRFIEKSHHLDGCQKARENWKECTCGKEHCLDLLYEVFEFHVSEEKESE
jgi:hypothetical protein